MHRHARGSAVLQPDDGIFHFAEILFGSKRIP